MLVFSKPLGEVASAADIVGTIAALKDVNACRDCRFEAQATVERWGGLDRLDPLLEWGR